MVSVTARRKALFAAALAAGALPYLGTLGHGFTLDDANTIDGHPGVKGPLRFDDVFLRDWWGRSRFDTIGTWRPLGTLTFWVDERVGGGRAWPFHLTNVILYVALLALVERFLRRWCADALSEGARVAAIVVLGTLASHSDVVPSPTGRAELLAAIFSFAALDLAACGPALGAREVALASGALFLALLSKESAAPVALLVPYIAHRARSAPGAGAATTTLPHRGLLALTVASTSVLALVAAFRALRMPFMSLGPERAPENPLLAVDTPHRLLGSLEVLALYLQHALGGAPLAPDYSYSEPPLLRSGWLGIVLGAITLASLVSLAAVSWKRAPRVADAVVAFGAAYVTVSDVFTAASAFADRLFFLPSFWLVIVAALVLERVARTERARTLVVAVAVAFAAWNGREAARDAARWRDDVTLLGAGVRAYPNVYRMQRNLAHALAEAGADDAAAWHQAAAESIFACYPAPIARDAIRPAWDDEPLAARLAHLQAALGTGTVCDATERARVRLGSWGAARGADALAAWRRAACPP